MSVFLSAPTESRARPRAADRAAVVMVGFLVILIKYLSFRDKWEGLFPLG
jgi:hypothetical protein